MSQISKCPKVTVILTYWEAAGDVSELRYKSLLSFSSKRSYCITWKYFYPIILEYLWKLILKVRFCWVLRESQPSSCQLTGWASDYLYRKLLHTSPRSGWKWMKVDENLRGAWWYKQLITLFMIPSTHVRYSSVYLSSRCVFFSDYHVYETAWRKADEGKMEMHWINSVASKTSIAVCSQQVSVECPLDAEHVKVIERRFEWLSFNRTYPGKQIPV